MTGAGLSAAALTSNAGHVHGNELAGRGAAVKSKADASPADCLSRVLSGASFQLVSMKCNIEV
jgi:hypothetical protein